MRPRPALAAAAALAVAAGVASAAGPVASLDGEPVGQVMAWLLPAVSAWLFLAFLPVFHDRPVAAAVLASLLVNLGAWLKRYVIIVPTLENPFLPIQRAPAGWAAYRPTWVEWSITAGALAGFALIYILFSKVFPIVSLWETREPAPAEGEGEGIRGADET